jgi:cysteine synthase A
MIYESVLDAIGHTPLVRLSLDAPSGVEVYAKLEMQNLFAMKDRVARNIVLEARKSGQLAEGAPIVESSSGTMALGIALVGTALGHPVHIVTDPRIDPITEAKLAALGATVHVVEQMDEHGWQGARLTRLAQVLDEHPGAFWPQQYGNPSNPAAYRTLAEELAADLGQVDVLVGAVGSGGSLCGTSRALRESLPDLRVVGVDSVGSVLFGQPDRPGRLQSGLGNSLHPPNLDASLIDEVHWLSDAEAYTSTRELALEQKLFAGNTSGSVYRVLRELARTAEPGTRLVGIFPDRGDRYVDTVYSDAFWTDHDLTPARHVDAAPRRVRPDTVVSDWSYRVDRSGDVLVFVEANTTGTGMLALRRATESGLRPVFVTKAPQRYAGLTESGCPIIRCDTDYPDAVQAALLARWRPNELAGVLTTSEFSLDVVATLAQRLGLPGNPVDAVTACRDKSALRAVLDTVDVPNARFRVVRTHAELPTAVAAVGLPCVVKPVDDSGSTGVLRCATLAEAEAHAATLLSRQVNGRGQCCAREILVEEYLAGPEFSVEMFVVDGAPIPIGITEKTVGNEPRFVESRHIFPAELPGPVARELCQVVGTALRAVGLRVGAAHVEVRLTERGPVIVEINARLGGGMIPELVRLATGVDLVAQYVNAFAGRPVTLTATLDAVAGIQFLLPSVEGELVEVHGLDAVRGRPGVDRVVVTAKPGGRVAPPVDAYGRIGYLIAHGSDRAEVVRALAEGEDLLSIEVDSYAADRRSA